MRTIAQPSTSAGSDPGTSTASAEPGRALSEAELDQVAAAGGPSSGGTGSSGGGSGTGNSRPPHLMLS
jgi:hypothetical protein